MNYFLHALSIGSLSITSAQYNSLTQTLNTSPVPAVVTVTVNSSTYTLSTAGIVLEARSS